MFGDKIDERCEAIFRYGEVELGDALGGIG